MPNKTQEITLNPSMGDNNQIVWTMSEGGKTSSPTSFTTDLKHGSGPAHFHFTIAPNQWSIQFNDGTGGNSPIFIQEMQGVNPASKPAPGVVNNQIEQVQVVKQGTELHFDDRNHGAERTLVYQLNFKNGISPVDPIIQNGGGGGPGQGVYSFFVDNPLASAAAVLVLLAAAWALFRRRSVRPVVNTTNTGGPEVG